MTLGRTKRAEAGQGGEREIGGRPASVPPVKDRVPSTPSFPPHAQEREREREGYSLGYDAKYTWSNIPYGLF